MQKLISSEAEVYRTRLDLLDKICGKASSLKQAHQLIASITQMTQQALNASASSLLLLDEKSQELIVKFADGPAGKQLKPLRINKQSGIAGWVAQNGKPLIVNDVSKDQRFYKFIDEVTGFTTRSIICVPLIVHRKVIGVIEVLNKLDRSGFNEHDLQILTGVATTAALGIENARLNQRLLNSYKGTINALVSAADSRETCTNGHSRRVSEYALLGANTFPLSKEEKQAIEWAAILHDIGKLGIPDNILNKSDTLTDQEWKIIRSHPVIGFNLLKEIPFLQEASKLVLYHHERYDGKGYPYGLKGEAIPMGSRLISIADAFDNMTTEHTYRGAVSKKEAMVELHNCTGQQFCPVAVKAFCSGFVKSQILGRK